MGRPQALSPALIPSFTLVLPLFGEDLVPYSSEPLPS